MIELVILACLAGAPREREAVRIPFEGPMTACVLHGRFVVATWTETHPTRRVVRWRCGPAERAI